MASPLPFDKAASAQPLTARLHPLKETCFQNPGFLHAFPFSKKIIKKRRIRVRVGARPVGRAGVQAGRGAGPVPARTQIWYSVVLLFKPLILKAREMLLKLYQQ